MDDDVAANPEHRHHAHGAEHLQKHRHAQHDAAAHGPHRPMPGAGQQGAEIVSLHDECNRAVNPDRHAQAHQPYHHRLQPQGPAGERCQGDSHDLGRQNEVGADGAADAFVFQVVRRLDFAAVGQAIAVGTGSSSMVAQAKQVSHLVPALKA